VVVGLVTCEAQSEPRLQTKTWRTGTRTRLDGARIDGTRIDGTRIDGTRIGGTRIDGTPRDGTTENPP